MAHHNRKMTTWQFLSLLWFSFSICDCFLISTKFWGRSSAYPHHHGLFLHSLSLESDPPWDISKLPLFSYNVKDPLVARVASIQKLVGPTAPSETFKIEVDHHGKYRFWEGQTCGVIPPGINLKTNKTHLNRLYSIASTRYGDNGQGRTLSLCVKRSLFYDKTNGVEDSTKNGICSNFLCNVSPGDEILLTGPMGKVLLLPEKNSAADIIMIATGTGIAPFRGFLRRLFVEDTPAPKRFTGNVWLMFGVANRDSLLFHDEFLKIKEENPHRFRFDYALSREEKNAHGDKMYVQDKIAMHSHDLFQRLLQGAHIYFCGIKAMMSPIINVLQEEAQKRSIVWATLLEQLKHDGRWHVEVY